MHKAILYFTTALLTTLPCQAQRWNWPTTHPQRNTAVIAEKNTRTEPSSAKTTFLAVRKLR